MKREKLKVYRIKSGCIERIVASGYVKIELGRFPALSTEKLDVVTSDYSSLSFERNFAVRHLKVSTSGYSELKGKGQIYAQTAALDSSSYSSLKSVNVLGNTTANSSGYSTLSVSVADKNRAEHDESGYSKCRVSRMDEHGVVEATLRLSALDAARRPSTSTKVKTEPSVVVIDEVKPEPEQRGGDSERKKRSRLLDLIEKDDEDSSRKVKKERKD